MRDVFGDYHPIINFYYFIVVLGFTMFLNHPVFLALSFISAFSYGAFLKGIKKTLQFLVFAVFPVMLFVVVINGAFNHYGVTALYYLESGNAITLEAIVYGLVMAGMFAAMMQWFSCYNKIMTSDKFMYLFGKVIPALSLLISMCLRFVPKFSHQIKVIGNGQKCIGRDVTNGNVVQKARHGIRIFSILVTWALENALDTADSMRARGYGLKGRTAFSIFHFEKRDKILLGIMAGLTAVVCAGLWMGLGKAVYDPKIIIHGWDAGIGGVFVYGAFGIFCFLPVLLAIVAEIRWNMQKKYIVNEAKGDFRRWECWK